MRNLEKIIINNRNSFDSLEPSEKHFQKFENKLNNYHKKNNNFSFIYILKAASVAVLIILSSVFIFDNLQHNEKTLSNISLEYRNVENYYTTLVNNKIDKINQLNHYETKKQKELFKKDFINSDSLYINMQKEMKTNSNDARVINAVINNYQMKIDILNNILKHLNNQTKTKTNENTQA